MKSRVSLICSLTQDEEEEEGAEGPPPCLAPGRCSANICKVNERTECTSISSPARPLETQKHRQIAKEKKVVALRV